MDNPSLDRYERQLYAVFKTFDVDGQEALCRAAVLALCDALQLEERGAELADALFPPAAAAAPDQPAPAPVERVSFTQFRSGLLAVLGAQPTPVSPAAAAAHSDEDSSGREAAPKLVVGSKRYGRRSRPPRASSAPNDAPLRPERARPRLRAASATPAESEPPPELQHDARIDCERALALCRRLRMDNVDRHLVETIFEATPAAETTVGEFFDRLNASLSTSIAAAGGESSGEVAGGGDSLPAELVVEAWEHAGVPQARRLLSDLGFSGAALRAGELELALDEELLSPDAPAAARALLLPAALALGRLRRRRAQVAAEEARAERDRLRADVGEADRRARLIAQEVDESQARLEAELAGSLRRAEARHAEAARAHEAELAAEHERGAAERGQLEGELRRRAEGEARLRGEAAAQRERGDALEARAAAAEESLAAAERERARLAGELREAQARAGDAAARAEALRAEAAARADELRRDNQRLRDRADELLAALEAAPGAARAGGAAHGASWREEAAGAAPHLELLQHSDEFDASLASAPAGGGGEAAGAEAGAAAGAEAGAEALRRELAAAEARHAEERRRLSDLVDQLEASLLALREEYERCEEYWAGKVAAERARGAEDAAAARAQDARLGALAARVAEYERQFAPRARLPPIEERAALEAQVCALEEECAAARREARAHLDARARDAERLAALQAEAARAQAQLSEQAARLSALAPAPAAPAPAPAAPAPAPVSPAPAAPLRRRDSHARAEDAEGACARCAWLCGALGAARAGFARETGALRARLARADAAVARLAARLQAADLLAKELYVETCLLPARPL